MESVGGIKKCPECGAPLKSGMKLSKSRLFVSILTGMVLGFGVGIWFVNWWFEGSGFTHDMAIIHEVAGAILGGLIGWGVGVVVSRP